MSKINIYVATQADLGYLEDVEKAIYNASRVKGTGIAIRSREYLAQKILEGKSVIAVHEDGSWAGFCYIESWGHNKYVANSGLVVNPDYRGLGLAGQIKAKALELSAVLFPEARLFGLTTSLAVMKINSSLGYQPVTFSELTDDEEFWKGCQSCPYYDILVRTRRSHCLCTAMLKPSPAETKRAKKTGAKKQDDHKGDKDTGNSKAA
ncbi:MAG: GNAT family N-acetyltransferase [Bacteroidales bacterium]|nr:GNAT family N-acetyltransferase [Bacteroidales bacterium]MDT8430342.1 GNAT family N-acetyltransferase [Bacteroidales bacterium]